jgi:hypothetical protein
MGTKTFQLRMPEDMYKAVSEKASVEGIPAAELIRRYIEKGIDINGYKSETEFIRNIIRQELESIVEPFGNRIIKMMMKIGKVNAGGFFVMLRSLFGKVTGENKAMFNDFMNRYMGMGVEYMSMKDVDVNRFLTADGTQLNELSYTGSIKKRNEAE